MALYDLKVKDEDAFAGMLDELKSLESDLNWIALDYVSREEVAVIGKGSGGLEQFKECLEADKVTFGVLEFVVEGDEYNTIKYVLVSWIGPEVPAGMQKARAGGHRSDLRARISERCPIASELQAERLDELTPDWLGQSISRMRGTYGAAGAASAATKQKSAGRGGTSRFEVVDEDSVVAALEGMVKGDADWLILAFVVGSRGSLELVKGGKGPVETLQQEWPADRVYFCVAKVQTTPEGDCGHLVNNTLTKWVLVSLVGSSVSPLVRARTAGQAKEVFDFACTYTPLHGIFQPNDPEDLTAKDILSKFK
jgi:Cofilin/tropomyosin-type actin-binding protein